MLVEVAAATVGSSLSRLATPIPGAMMHTSSLAEGNELAPYQCISVPIRPALELSLGLELKSEKQGATPSRKAARLYFEVRK